ncbi:MAG: hypothetical protein ABIK15_07485 [Pseudomonadota bacterium]
MSKTQPTLKAIRKEMHHIINQAHTLVDVTSGEVDERIKSARNALKDRLESAKDEYGELENQLLDKVKAADDFIHQEPYYAIGGTLMAGLFLGWFISRK